MFYGSAYAIKYLFLFYSYLTLYLKDYSLTILKIESKYYLELRKKISTQKKVHFLSFII